MLELALSNWPIIAGVDTVIAIIISLLIRWKENKKFNYNYPSMFTYEHMDYAFLVLVIEDNKVLLEYRKTNSNLSNSRKSKWFNTAIIPKRYLSSGATFQLTIKGMKFHFSDFTIEEYNYLDRKWYVENF